MSIVDEIRLNILEALLKPNSVIPNIRQIKHHTGYHKATIKSSLDFLKKAEVLQGFGPKVNFRRLGYPLEVVTMLQADLSKESVFKKFLSIVEQDNHLYSLSAVIGSGNWNLIARHLYKDIESYHQQTQKNYYGAIPQIYELVRDRQIFFATEPHYKSASRTQSIINAIKKDKGFV
jgi:DNA-binding Lrp family transcriptional regulator